MKAQVVPILSILNEQVLAVRGKLRIHRAKVIRQPALAAPGEIEQEDTRSGLGPGRPD
jgi:hypothetical protein